MLLEPRRRGEQRVGIGDVDRFSRRLGAKGFELAPDLFERLRIASDQADPVAGAGEAAGNGAPDSRGRPGDENDAAFGAHGSTGKASVERSAICGSRELSRVCCTTTGTLERMTDE